MFPVAVSVINNRRHRRHAVGFAAPLQAETGGRFLCRVEDMSQTGARLTTYSALKPGTTVTMELLDDVIVQAEIIWADDFEAGCSFERALDQTALDRVLSTRNKPAGHIPRH